MATRSVTFFASNHAANGTYTEYTCPAGFIALVKYSAARVRAGDGNPSYVLQAVIGGVTVELRRTKPAGIDVDAATYFVCLTAGDTLQSILSNINAGGTLSLVVAGALLPQ